MCDELAWRISGCSESIGKRVAQNNSETMVMPTELSTTNKTPGTNEIVQGNLVHGYERKFANLPDHLQLIKLCSNAGIAKTVAKEHLDDAELDNLGGSYREYTLPRDDTFSKVKGWIRGNTKIGPVLEVTVSYHQGHYGIEIRINPFFGDVSQSWVMIGNGLNKYVTEMSEEIQADRNDAIETSARRLAAKARPKQTSLPMSSFPRVTISFPMREWVDVESGEYDQNSFDVAKKMTRLLKRDPSVLREDDGAVKFKIMASMFPSELASSLHLSIRTRPSYLQRGGGPKKRFQYCVAPLHADTISYFRAIQDHSAGKQIDPSSQDNV